ncbi:hypothetical protein BH23ACT5_BH23ACT5_24190 [soil metagenome]
MSDRNQHERTEREVIVTDGRGGSGVGMILAAIIGVLGILLVVWLFLNLGGNDGGEGGVIPDEINVDIDSGGGGGEGDEG